jgi:hypothetical protein
MVKNLFLGKIGCTFVGEKHLVLRNNHESSFMIVLQIGKADAAKLSYSVKSR